ncbi:hypothetical protein ACFVH4_09530 [Nocardia ignorata]|uniref:hypothetical protein n=1 Tax=Nocardia ignorata TaxID=145285 RepID=UPI00362F6F36
MGRNDTDDDICGPCSGRTDLDWSCRTCSYPGYIYANGMCARCVARDSVKELLGDGNGPLSSQLQPLVDALTTANPTSVLSWLHRRTSAKLLTDLAEARTEITHDRIDELPQGSGTNHLRELLVSTGILPRRNEPLVQLKLWLDRTVADLPPHQQVAVRPFAEWQVLRDARRRATQGRYTAGAAHADRTDIRAAINFMNWLDAENLILGDATQEDLDRWIDEHPTQRTRLNLYLSWTAKRHLTARFDLPKDSRGLPSLFLEEDEHRQQLRRCLSEETLPLEVRIIGALIRIYGLPVTRIVELTTDRYYVDDTSAYLTIVRNPVLLPPKLARLIEQQCTRRNSSMLRHVTEGQPIYLFPGRPPSRPRNVTGIGNLMRAHGLPALRARNTAMIENVTGLPAIVISDLFGVHPTTAHRWAQFAQDGWADYLAASPPLSGSENRADWR